MDKVYLLFKHAHWTDGEPEITLCAVYKTYEAAEDDIKHWNTFCPDAIFEIQTWEVKR